MLQSLHIQNYALIDELDISFGKGFSVITGETGAGKSIMLGAIGLLLGQRADSKSIKDGRNKCVVEARFNVSGYNLEGLFEANDLEYDAEECILRRELQANGKSRAFINDSPAPLSLMKDIGERLIDVHSQHQNLLLNREDFQMDITDILAHDAKEKSEYQEAYSHFLETSQQLKRLQESIERNKADEDYWRFQLEQLDNAQLSEGEQEDLENEAEMLAHAEDIKAGLYKVGQMMNNDENGVLQRLKEATHVLQNLRKVFKGSEELAERMESCYIEMKDIAQEATAQEENIDFNPGRLDWVNERLNLIYSLQQKHHVKTVKELLSIANGFREKLNAIDSSGSQIEELEKQRNAFHAQATARAALLTQKRKEAATVMEKQMTLRLKALGMPNACFTVEVTPRKELGAAGGDNITFLFSANKNGALQPIASVASGGEISRVMLSIKAMISGATRLPAIIFDEIDTGVSGTIADKMASIMQEMGRDMQVISITHLPQIAAKGNAHYKVSKQDTEQGTSSHIRLLTPQERIEEIARMLSGASLTEAAINNAKELLNNK